MALVRRVIALREEETVPEWSPVGDSQSNGRAERAVQAVEEQTRVLKLSLERRIGGSVPADHPVVTWLVRHSADVLTKLERKKNGRTAYEMIKGRAYHGELVEFAQKVLYRLPGKFRGGTCRQDGAREHGWGNCGRVTSTSSTTTTRS